MHNWRHNLFCLSIASFIAGSSLSCSSNIEVPKTRRNCLFPIKDAAPMGAPLSSKNDESIIDLEQESTIEKMCLEAWRKCIAGNKKAGIADLKKLSQQYPKSSSVMFMTGQVLEKFGDKKEALAYYEKAADNSDFAVMSLFKIAESMRTTGNTEQALIRYKKLITIAPQFSLAHLGLAKTLIKLDPASEKAKEELKTVLELDPNNQEAKTLLQSYKSP